VTFNKLWVVLGFPILVGLNGCVAQAPIRADDPIYNANIGEFALKVSKMYTDSHNPDLSDKGFRFEESNSWRHWQYNVSGHAGFMRNGDYFKNYCAARGGTWTLKQAPKTNEILSGSCDGKPQFEIRIHRAYRADKLVVGNSFSYYLADIFDRKEQAGGAGIESEFKLTTIYRPDNFQNVFGQAKPDADLPFEAFVLRDLAAEQRLRKQDQELYQAEQEQHRAQLAKLEKMRAPGANTLIKCETNIPDKRSLTLDDIFFIEYSPTKGLINKRKVGQEWHSEVRINHRLTLVKSRWTVTDDEFVLTESSANGDLKTIVNRTNGYFVKASLNNGAPVARGSCQG
jgi:hypothetical protein